MLLGSLLYAEKKIGDMSNFNLINHPINLNMKGNALGINVNKKLKGTS